MKFPLPNKNFDHLLHPYVFVLKEGQKIQNNLLDYSLLLLHVGQMEIIPSPHLQKASTPTVQLLKK